MKTITTLLTEFGFTRRTATVLSQSANKHGLTPKDVLAWITEARSSTTLHNPRGFVRARIVDGDSPPTPPIKPGSREDRRRYLTWSDCVVCQKRPCVCATKS